MTFSIVDYAIPAWNGETTGLVHGMTESFRPFQTQSRTPYQHTVCGRTILRWWRRARPGERRYCRHCKIIMDYLKRTELPPPPEPLTTPMQLVLWPPPRPDCP